MNVLFINTQCINTCKHSHARTHTNTHTHTHTQVRTLCAFVCVCLCGYVSCVHVCRYRRVHVSMNMYLCILDSKTNHCYISSDIKD